MLLFVYKSVFKPCDVLLDCGSVFNCDTSATVNITNTIVNVLKHPHSVHIYYRLCCA